jgi:hypothetical protein
MTWNSQGDELGRAGHEIRSESQRLRAAARAAVTRSRTARAAAVARDPVARRDHLLAVKAREIAQIENAIQVYVRMATYWRERSNIIMADKLDARLIVERDRLALANAERDAWPAINGGKPAGTSGD